MDLSPTAKSDFQQCGPGLVLHDQGGEGSASARVAGVVDVTEMHEPSLEPAMPDSGRRARPDPTEDHVLVTEYLTLLQKSALVSCVVRS